MKDARRLDQWLSNLGYCSRREARDWLKSGRVTAPDGAAYGDPALRLSASIVRVEGEPLDHPDGLVLLMHKPLGHVCSHDPREGPRVYDLLPERWLRRSPELNTIGRLDKDTTGLLLITDRTALVHQLTSPKHRISKTYQAVLSTPVAADRQSELTQRFAAGDLLLAGDNAPCAAATLTWRSPIAAELILFEGRYHHVRRMFAAMGHEVVALHRSAFGPVNLPESLYPSDFMELSPDIFG